MTFKAYIFDIALNGLNILKTLNPEILKPID